MNHSLSSWVDCTVKANDGVVGKVEQFYFDDLTWKVRYLSANTGRWLPGRNVLISMAALGKPDWGKRLFRVNLTQAQVRASPERDAGAPVSRRHEAELHEHYEWPVYWNTNFYVPAMGGMIVEPIGYGATPETPPSEARKVDPHLRGIREIDVCRVHATDGHIGHVEDAIVDDATWAIRYLVVNTRNWLPERRVLVSPQWITRVNWADQEVFVDLSRDAVKRCPRFDPTKPLTLDYESKLLSHLRKPEATEWVLFRFHAPRESTVYVAGTFNNWDPAGIQLAETARGAYTATVLLPPGRHEYKFIVNGQWRNGPDCRELVPNAFGTTNGVLVVGSASGHDMHIHTFSRLQAGEDRLLWSTGMAD